MPNYLILVLIPMKLSKSCGQFSGCLVESVDHKGCSTPQTKSEGERLRSTGKAKMVQFELGALGLHHEGNRRPSD